MAKDAPRQTRSGLQEATPPARRAVSGGIAVLLGVGVLFLPLAALGALLGKLAVAPAARILHGTDHPVAVAAERDRRRSLRVFGSGAAVVVVVVAGLSRRVGSEPLPAEGVTMLGSTDEDRCWGSRVLGAMQQSAAATAACFAATDLSSDRIYTEVVVNAIGVTTSGRGGNPCFAAVVERAVRHAGPPPDNTRLRFSIGAHKAWFGRGVVDVTLPDHVILRSTWWPDPNPGPK